MIAQRCAERRQRRRNPLAARRLAVRARDADGQHAVARVVVPGARNRTGEFVQRRHGQRHGRIDLTAEAFGLNQHGCRATLDRAVDERAVVRAVDGVGEKRVAGRERARVGVQMRAWLHVSVQPGEGVGDLPVRWMLLAQRAHRTTPGCVFALAEIVIFFAPALVESFFTVPAGWRSARRGGRRIVRHHHLLDRHIRRHIQRTQRIADDRREHRARHLTAEVAACRRFVDRHRHHDARIRHRRHADERRAILGLVVAVRTVLVRGTALAAHAIARHRRIRRRAARRRHGFEHGAHFTRGGRRERFAGPWPADRPACGKSTPA